MEDEIGDKGHAGNLITHMMDSEYSNSTIQLQKIKLLSRSKGAMLNSKAPHIAVCEVILGLFFFFGVEGLFVLGECFVFKQD